MSSFFEYTKKQKNTEQSAKNMSFSDYTKVRKVDINSVVNNFKNTDIKEIEGIIKTIGSGEWQNAETMKWYTDKINRYVNNYVALESMGYFNHLPEEERKGYVESLKEIKKFVNSQKDAYGDYEDADSYKDAVVESKKQMASYEQMKKEDLVALRKQIDEMKAEYEYWKAQEVSLPNGDVYVIPTPKVSVQEKYFGKQNTIQDLNKKTPYFSGKTLEEAKKEIDELEAYFRQAEGVQIGVKFEEDALNAADFEEKSTFISKIKDKQETDRIPHF